MGKGGQLLLFELAAGWHGWRQRGVAIDLLQQGRDVHIQKRSQLFQHIEGDVLSTAFDPPDIGSVDTSFERQALLRQAPVNPQLAKIPANEFARVHAHDQAILRLDNRRTHNPILNNCRRLRATSQGPGH